MTDKQGDLDGQINESDGPQEVTGKRSAKLSRRNLDKKGKILDGDVSATDYEREYASRLLSAHEISVPRKKRPSVQQV